MKRVAQRVRDGRVFAFGDDPATVGVEKWARHFFQVKYALATNSGTAALYSAYRALGLRPGDRVLVPAYTFHATVTPLLQLGVEPVFYDCEPGSPAPDLASAERLVAGVQAVVVCHMFGLMAHTRAMADLADRHGVPLVEDASQAHGAHDDRGRLAGTVGRVGCFSMGGQKMITGGMGGLLITNDREVYEYALNLGHSHERAAKNIPEHSINHRVSEVGLGQNFRMHPLAAELCLDHCSTLAERIERRSALLDGLSERLRRFAFLRAPTTAPGTSRGGWYGYKAVFEPRELPGVTLAELIAELRHEGLEVSQPTTKPLHETILPTLAGIMPVTAPGTLANSSDLYARTIGFPDKHFHSPCEDLLDQYALGVERAAQRLSRR